MYLDESETFKLTFTHVETDVEKSIICRNPDLSGGSQCNLRRLPSRTIWMFLQKSYFPSLYVRISVNHKLAQDVILYWRYLLDKLQTLNAKKRDDKMMLGFSSLGTMWTKSYLLYQEITNEWKGTTHLFL